MKRCVWDGGPIIRKTVTQWVCGTCGLPYGSGLMQNRDDWRTFRRRAKAAIAIERQTKTDAQIRPLLGATLVAILKAMEAGR